MSQSAAQAIIQMYTQSNTQRIDQALQLAFQEAQQLQLSEQATRKLLLEQLQREQKSYNDYVAQLQKARVARARNDNDLARESMRIAYSNIAANERAREENLRIREKGSAQATTLYNVDSGTVDDFADVIGGLSDELKKGSPLSIIMRKANDTEFDRKLGNAKIKLSNSKYTDIDGNPTTDFLVSDLVDEIMFGISQRSGLPESDPKLQEIRKYMTDPNVPGASNRSGALAGLQYQAPIVRDTATINYTNEYEAKYGKSTKGSRTRSFGAVTQTEKNIINAARPVLNALSAADDTPFEITDAERAELPDGAMAAYDSLKTIVKDKPTVVGLDELTLLDEIALQRALRLKKLETKAEQPLRKPQSTEVTLARAAEIAEPRLADRSKQQMAARPAHEQKYFASERKALELSDQDDEYVRKMGKPEEYGVIKWKEVWDGSQMSSDYGTIIGDIETQFKDPADQLKAIAAFNSRAMALQRAKSPILVEGGQLSEDYKAALEAMTPKEK